MVWPDSLEFIFYLVFGFLWAVAIFQNLAALAKKTRDAFTGQDEKGKKNARTR
jgi:hypothetical protein